MNKQLIVTHCLALLNQHAGLMTQSDKDFFDARVDNISSQTDDAFMAVLLLLTMRLAIDLPTEQAEGEAMSLVQPHAERYGLAKTA